MSKKTELKLGTVEYEVPLYVGARIISIYVFEERDCVYVSFEFKGILGFTKPWLNTVRHALVAKALEAIRKFADDLSITVPVNPETEFYAQTLWISLK